MFANIVKKNSERKVDRSDMHASIQVNVHIHVINVIINVRLKVISLHIFAPTVGRNHFPVMCVGILSLETLS